MKLRGRFGVEDAAMYGPGEYVPDGTEGITRVVDLPKPRVEPRSRNYPARRCPRCGARAGRYATATRTMHDLGDPRAGRPIDLVVTFSRHHCPACDLFFPVNLADLADPRCQYTRRVQELAVRLVVEDGLPYQTAEWHLWRDHRIFVPWATIQNWVEAAGEKKDRDDHDHLSGRGPGRLLRLPGHR
jgi:transposase